MAQLTSSPSNTETVVSRPLSAWLKDPLDPSRNMPLGCIDNLSWTRSRGQAVLTALGRADPIVQTDVRRLRTGSLVATPLSQQEADRLDGLLQTARTLLLHVPPATLDWRGEAAYVLATGDDTTAPIGQARLDNRTVTVPLTEVRRPAG